MGGLTKIFCNIVKLLEERIIDTGNLLHINSTASLTRFERTLLSLHLPTLLRGSTNTMGANQSQPRTTSPEPYVSPEERAQAQADVIPTSRAPKVVAHRTDLMKMRAKQQAALDKRLAGQPRKPSPSPTANNATQLTNKPQKTSALEQMSRENVGWRNADANREMRSWN